MITKYSLSFLKHVVRRYRVNEIYMYILFRNWIPTNKCYHHISHTCKKWECRVDYHRKINLYIFMYPWIQLPKYAIKYSYWYTELYINYKWINKKICSIITVWASKVQILSRLTLQLSQLVQLYSMNWLWS
jgi:hypothetical protein